MITGVKYIMSRGSSGYSEAAKDYIIALHKAGIPVTVEYMVHDNSDYRSGERNKLINTLLDQQIEYNKVIIHTTPEFWPNYIREEKKEGIEIIGMSVWETDKLDDRWVGWVNMVDKVIVPCTWNKEVYLNSGIIKPIEVIPHIFKELPKAVGEIKGVNKSDTVFYTIGQWSNRKGVDDTIKAYLEAFTSTDSVCLIVKTFGNNYKEDQRRIIRNHVNDIMKVYPDPAKVILLLREFSDIEMAALHGIGDCYVTLCKSEGFGLGMFDALGYKNPVLCTGYGGHLDFIDNKKWLIPYTLVPVSGMSWIPWYGTDQRWAQPDVQKAANKMRRMKKYISAARKDAQVKQIYIKNFYNYTKVGESLIQTLNQ